MPWLDDLLECKLRDSIKIDGPKPVNKGLHDAFQGHVNYDLLRDSTKIKDDLAFLLSVSQAHVQSAASTIFRAYLAKTIAFRKVEIVK